ncbi:NADH-quinone oxidoreductase subunit N [soil metagenome]
MTLPADFIVFSILGPAIVMLVFAMITLLFAVFQVDRSATASMALVGVGTAAVFALHLLMKGQQGAAEAGFGLRYLGDTPATAFTLVILLGTALAILVSEADLSRLGLDHPEYYPLMLLSATGAIVLASAGDLITLLLGLEIMSLAVYALAAWRQGSRQSEEAGMKYFLLGAFASALLIYGIALTFGAGGRFDYAGLAAAFSAPGFDAHVLALLGSVLLLAGLGFKVAFAPFHQWLPDVYTGAPTPVTTFMSVVVKTAAFAALLRIASTVFASLGAGPLGELLPIMLGILIGATLIVGNFGALLQSGVKRMLAYSAVAHAGYLGLAVLAADTVGTNAAIFYLTAYTLMTAGAFAVLSAITNADDRGDEIERFAGLAARRPFLAASLAIVLMSLAGLPPFAGFVGKLLVFQAAISAGYVALAVLGIATSVVAVVYYARVITYMYFRESDQETIRPLAPTLRIAVVIAVVGTIALGILPGFWYGLVERGQVLLAGF